MTRSNFNVSKEISSDFIFSKAVSVTSAVGSKTLKRNLPRCIGKRFTNGNWPPSNHNGDWPLLRARWPLVPRPTVCSPFPLPRPRPNLFEDFSVIFGKFCSNDILFFLWWLRFYNFRLFSFLDRRCGFFNNWFASVFTCSGFFLHLL